MGCGIYSILNTSNNKKYIGSSIKLESRKYKHFWMLLKQRHDNQFLQKSYNKYGKSTFIFEIIEECDPLILCERENHYIKLYNSNDPSFGYNLATVNEFRRNNYNEIVKINLSKYNLNKNGNFNEFSLTNIETNTEYKFDNLVDAANYLIEEGFAKGKPSYVRMSISNSLRGKKVDNGSNGSIRKTCYKHRFKIIN
jgi:hypothetical protein